MGWGEKVQAGKQVVVLAFEEELPVVKVQVALEAQPALEVKVGMN